MQNDGTYFALIPQANGTIKRTYPKQIWLSHYQGIEMFAYRTSFEGWGVIEKTTGLPIATSRYSRTDALARSKENIDKKGAENVLRESEIARQAIDTMTIYEENID
jgi:hypothetical protein